MDSHSETLQKAIAHHEAGELDRAESLYREILRADAAHPDALHLMGVAAHQRQRDDEAVAYITQAIAAGGTSPLYHSNLGASYRRLGRNREAIGSFREAIQIAPDFAGAHYNLAMALAAEGEWGQAAASFCDATRVNPEFADAFNGLARIYSQQGKHAEAADTFRQALALDPGRADIQYNLGNTHAALADDEAAIECFREAIRLVPEFVEAHNNLGTVLKSLGCLDEAAASFRKAVELRPAYAEATYNLGTAYQAMGQLDDAIECIERAAQSSTVDVGFLLRIAASLREQGSYEKSTKLYQRALEIDPNLADACFGLGYIAMSEGRHDEARRWYEQALWMEPDHVGSLTNLGSMHLSAKRPEDAADCFRRVADRQPDNPVSHYNLGNALKDSWMLDDAATAYTRAIQRDPQLAEAHINLGVVLQRLGKLDDAVDSHTRAIQIRPDDAEAHFHRAQSLLQQGDFRKGWAEYEWRWQYNSQPRSFPQPEWDGSPLDGRSLLVYSEQGVGDEIMFASCLPELIGQTERCVLECDRRLVPLFQRSFPLATVTARFDEKDAPAGTPGTQTDLQIAAGSLPRHLRRNLEAFPTVRRYLAPDVERIESWQKRLAELGEGLKVGISWRGGAASRTQKLRSARLDDLRPILSLPGVQFVNLQYGDCAEELEEAQQTLGVAIHDWDDADPLANLDNFAAQIAALDLVISVDNATVHMAGAVGATVWTLLPSAPNWRWLHDRDDTPWYSTMKLFRQSQPYQWQPVFEQVAGELQRMASNADAATHVDCRSAKSPEGNPTASVPAHTNDSDSVREQKKYERIWTHDAYRKKSFGLMDAEKVGLIDKLRSHGVRTVLDAGCGTGKLMQKLIVDHSGEFEVHGFDISANCLDPFFNDIKDDVLTVGCLWNPEDLDEVYDAVLCTDVMEHIPTKHVPQVLENLHRSTGKLCYFAIALFPDSFGPELVGEPLHLTVKPPNWWYAKLAVAGFQILGHAVETHPTGQDLWLHAFAAP